VFFFFLVCAFKHEKKNLFFYTNKQLKMDFLDSLIADAQTKDVAMTFEEEAAAAAAAAAGTKKAGVSQTKVKKVKKPKTKRPRDSAVATRVSIPAAELILPALQKLLDKSDWDTTDFMEVSGFVDDLTSILKRGDLPDLQQSDVNDAVQKARYRQLVQKHDQLLALLDKEDWSASDWVNVGSYIVEFLEDNLNVLVDDEERELARRTIARARDEYRQRRQDQEERLETLRAQRKRLRQEQYYDRMKECKQEARTLLVFHCGAVGKAAKNLVDEWLPTMVKRYGRRAWFEINRGRVKKQEPTCAEFVNFIAPQLKALASALGIVTEPCDPISSGRVQLGPPTLTTYQPYGKQEFADKMRFEEGDAAAACLADVSGILKHYGVRDREDYEQEKARLEVADRKVLEACFKAIEQEDITEEEYDLIFDKFEALEEQYERRMRERLEQWQRE
jgi:hypothetical protein